MDDMYCVALSALDDFDRAILRFDGQRALTYANAAGVSLIGATPEDGVTLADLFPDPEQWQQVAAEFETRRRGRASVYNVVLRRRRPFAGIDCVDIPVSVFAFPESDGVGGFLGSVAMLRDLREETASAAIHRAIGSSTDNGALFASLAGHLRPLIPFDELRVSVVSKSGVHVRQLYSSDRQAPAKYPFRWYPMTPFMAHQMQRQDVRLRRIDDMRVEPGYADSLQDDSQLARYFASGVREIITLPVVEQGRVVAAFSLDTHADNRYDDSTLELLGRLPLREAAAAAFAREQRDRQESLLKLLRRLGQMNADVQEMADAIVTMLAADFGWDSVAIFQSVGSTPTMRLAAQAAQPGFERADDLRLDRPVPAEASAVEPDTAAAHAPETIAGPFASALYGPDPIAWSAPQGEDVPLARRARGVQSTCAVRIAGRRACWLLLVESRERNAFSVEELEVLNSLATEAAGALHRSALFEMQSAVLASIDDAVIETNDDGRLRWFSAAARRMLGRNVEDDGAGGGRDGAGNIADVVLEPDASAILEHDLVEVEAVLRRADGSGLSVLLSSHRLPEHVGGRLFIASDYSAQKELRRMRALQEVFRLAAMEGRVPLALAASWLRQLAVDDVANADEVRRILHQMARADMPLDRLMRIFVTEQAGAAPTTHADLLGVVRTTLAELPAKLRAAIDAQLAGDRLPVRASFDDLQFCVESLISFGLRTRPLAQRLVVKVDVDDDSARFAVDGDWRLPDDDATSVDVTDRWERKSLRDVAFGESVVERLVTAAQGSYTRGIPGRLAFEMRLPLAIEEVRT